MRISALLSVLYVCFRLHQYLASAEIVTAHGTYIVTDDNYRSTMIHNALAYDNDIAWFPIYTSDVRSMEAAFECGKHCLKEPLCKSFFIKKSRRKCALSRVSKCENPRRSLYNSGDWDYFEIFTRPQNDPPKTCFQGCIEEFSCSECGRGNCSGARCDKCTEHCWDIPGGFDGLTFVWTLGQTDINERICDGEWERLWFNGGMDEDTLETPDFPVKLKLVLKYSNGAVKTSYFESVSMSGNALSVGAFVNGTAGNFWEAPFTYNSILLYRNRTCKPFWYPTNVTACEANGITEPTVINGTVLSGGYSWFTGDNVTDSLVIKAIQLWMTKA